MLEDVMSDDSGNLSRKFKGCGLDNDDLKTLEQTLLMNTPKVQDTGGEKTINKDEQELQNSVKEGKVDPAVGCWSALDGQDQSKREGLQRVQVARSKERSRLSLQVREA